MTSSKESRRSSLKQFPLGPPLAGHSFPEHTFEHDGGEIIFSLPNGLQGYLLTDGKDNRIDAGPIEVVSDAQKTSGSNVIVNGVSCMACHKHGMIAPPRDEVREGSAVFGDARRKLLRLYPEPKAFLGLFKEDEDRFLRAAEKATGPFLKVGPDREREVRDFPAEPVGEVARLYALQELDLAMTALELGVENPNTLKAMIQGNKRLRELGLGPLVNDGVLKRDEWEKGRGFSLMQRVARELDLGTPFRSLDR